jgi:streptomycin 6-kinase
LLGLAAKPVSVVQLICQVVWNAGHAVEPTLDWAISLRLHFGNVLRASREPWLAVDPKGWCGCAEFDAFTVIAGRPDDLTHTAELEGAICGRVHRYSTAAGVDAEVALACCQARATSSYLYQQAQEGQWFDLEFLRCMIAITA